jgi:hypothetical protein
MEVYWDMLKELNVLPSNVDSFHGIQEQQEKNDEMKINHVKSYDRYCNHQIFSLNRKRRYQTVVSHTHPGKGRFELPDGFQYDFQQIRSVTFRKVHFYSRLSHFKFKLNRLLAYDGDIPEKVHSFLNGKVKKKQWKSKYIYRHIRKHLKKEKWQKFYVLIPSIIHFYTGQNIKVSEKIYSWMLNIFFQMEKKFFHLKHHTTILDDRTYFPSYHYIIVQLLELFGVEIPYIIPGCLTQRKKFSLNYLFNTLLPLNLLEQF